MTARSFAPFSRSRTVLTASFLGVVVVGGGWLLHRGTGFAARTFLGAAPETPVRGSVLFDNVRELIAKQYLDSIPASQLYQNAVAGMIGQLNDPYSVYLTPERLSRLTERMSGNYAGIGLQVDVRDGNLVVVAPIPGGPGERAGILTGDQIVEIDGKVVYGWTPDEVQKLLRGAPGSAVTVTVQHAGSGVPLKLTLHRAEIHRSAIGHAALLSGNVGYVTLKVFSDSTALELRESIDSLLRAGARGVVLDLRGNPGGLLEQGVKVADLFLDSAETVVSTHGRIPDANHTYVDSTRQRWPSLPLVVLVDDKTASAAELVAGALQDNDRAAIVGTTTYGKGSAQSVFPLEGAGALKLTTARWYTPLGRAITRRTRGDDGAPADSGPRPTVKTESGRTLLGGGSITPDVAVGDTAASPENLALLQALGKNVGHFRDALASYALSLKTTRPKLTPNFVVTPVMLDDVYKRMTARDVEVPRFVYDEARPLVSRLLAYEIERYVFGSDAEERRRMLDDRVIQTSQRLLTGATSPADVLKRAEAVPKEKRAG